MTTGPSGVVVLIGPMGAGKSTVGARLAALSGTDLVDTDLEIVRRTGRTIPDIFDADGEAGFRAIEQEVVVDVLGRREGVVALGGGSVLSAVVRAALRDHHVVYLQVDPSVGFIRAHGGARPLLAAVDRDDARRRYEQILAERAELYRSLASQIVDGADAAESVAAAIDAHRRRAFAHDTTSGHDATITRDRDRPTSESDADRQGAQHP